MKRAGIVLLFPVLILSGCATSEEGRRGWERLGKGVANLLLSPFMIVAGLAEGLAFLPYTIGTGVKDLDKALVQANAVSLNDSYKATFGVPIDHPDVDPKSGDILRQAGIYGMYKPEALFQAQRAFERLLVSQGMPEEKARYYVVVGDYTYAWSRGHIILAVVYRHPGAQPIRVVSKHTGIVTTLRPSYHQGWHEAYMRDTNGQVIDEVIDWAAMEYAILRQDKVVAALMVLAVEGVKSGKRAPDYWPVERRWAAGETGVIIQESLDKVRRSLPSASPYFGPSFAQRKPR